jgi:hypothetical protein
MAVSLSANVRNRRNGRDNHAIAKARKPPISDLPLVFLDLKQGGLFDGWVAGCPLLLTSPNAPGKREAFHFPLRPRRPNARWYSMKNASWPIGVTGAAGSHSR